jgi:hypothetical protein
MQGYFYYLQFYIYGWKNVNSNFDFTSLPLISQYRGSSEH